MSALVWVQLKKESPFYGIFENGQAPVKSLSPQSVRLEGNEENSAYMLNWNACEPAQQQAIAELVTKLLGGSRDQFLQQMQAGSDMPIRESQTEGAAASLRAFL